MLTQGYGVDVQLDNVHCSLCVCLADPNTDDVPCPKLEVAYLQVFPLG